MSNMSSHTSISIEEFSSALTKLQLLVVGVTLIVICVITVMGNALVLISFALDKKLRTLSNYFILSLAVSDFMIAVFSMPIYTAYTLIGEWTFGPVVCDMWLAQDYTCSSASCLNLLMIGFDRYFSVKSPLKYRVKRTGKRVAFMIGCVWIISLFVWSPWIYGWPYIEGRRTVADHDCYVQILEANPYITIVTVLVDYYVPVFIILVLYYKIWRLTKKRRKYLANMETGYQSESVCLQTKATPDEQQCPEQLPLKSLAKHNGIKTSGETEIEVALLNGTRDNKEAAFCDNGDIQTSLDLNSVPSQSSEPSYAVGESKASSQKGTASKQDKAARVLTSILLAFLITTTPYNVLVIVKLFDDAHHTLVPFALWNFGYFLFYVNSTLNPLCYALANQTFRKTYWKILSCSWNKKPQHDYDGYSSKSTQSKESYSNRRVTSAV